MSMKGESRKHGEASIADTGVNRATLDQQYRWYNRKEFVHPDPLEFLYQYPDIADREVVGMVASSLAYGRVARILRSVSLVLEEMGGSPAAFLMESTDGLLERAFPGFRHRFTDGDDVIGMLRGIRSVIRRHGSLNTCFARGIDPADETVVPALSRFTSELTGEPGCSCGSLLPSPEKGSACKRLNLFLRWMVRRDQVDPGGWEGVSPSKLVVPLDTHMHGISLTMGLTRRKQADMRTALEITEAFRAIAPEDPVRYDFALTRPGIRGGRDVELVDDCVS